MRQRKDLPGLITQHACCKQPMSDNSSPLAQEHLPLHCRIIARRRSSFAWGRLRVMETVSINIPRNTILVGGPSVLVGATGTHTGLMPYTRSLHTEEHQEPQTAESHPDNGYLQHHHGSPESIISRLPPHCTAWGPTGGQKAALYPHKCGPATTYPTSDGHRDELGPSEKHQTRQILPALHPGPASTGSIH